MKMRSFVFLVASTVVAMTASAALPSGVYRWQELPVQPTPVGERRAIIDARTLDLDPLLVHATTVGPGKAAHAPHAHPELEELVIVRSGQLRVTCGSEDKVIGPGGLALLADGVMHGLANAGDEPVTYYVIRYSTKPGAGASPEDAEARQSLLLAREETTFQPFATGGRRQMFNRATPMLENFAVHVTTLNGGLQNHATHTHRVEEMVLILRGEVELQIGEDWHRASPGDLIFLESQIPHALRNVGTEPTEYFAIQWRVAE